MNKTVKTRWIKALRSGNYLQGKTVFKSPDGKQFSALGVLCDIHNPNQWTLGGLLPKYPIWFWDGRSETFDDYLLKKLRLSAQLQDRIIQLNDVDGKSFEEIATFLEHYNETH